jgi:hypothetical protein
MPTSSATSRFARRLHGAHDGVEMVVLDSDAGTEGRLESAVVGAGGGAPAEGVEKGIEASGIVEAGRRRER